MEKEIELFLITLKNLEIMINNDIIKLSKIFNMKEIYKYLKKDLNDLINDYVEDDPILNYNGILKILNIKKSKRPINILKEIYKKRLKKNINNHFKK